MRARKKRTRPALDDRHYLAIELLTTVPTPNLEDIAVACGVDRRTLFRWRLRKDFDREYVRIRNRKSSAITRYKRAALPLNTATDIEKYMRIHKLL